MKEPKRPSHGLSKSLPFFARATLCEHSVERRLSLVSATLTTPPYRIPCGANWSALRTTICWRYCRFAKQICSYSSIGTDTRCCSNGAGFLFDITFCWWGNNHQRIYTKEMIGVLTLLNTPIISFVIVCLVDYNLYTLFANFHDSNISF